MNKKPKVVMHKDGMPIGTYDALVYLVVNNVESLLPGQCDSGISLSEALEWTEGRRKVNANWVVNVRCLNQPGGALIYGSSLNPPPPEPWK